MVFINVPHTRTPQSSKACTRLIVETCNAPYLDCDETGLFTFDEAHLTKRSATLYTERLVHQLADLMAGSTVK